MICIPLNEEASLGIVKHLNKDGLQKPVANESKLEDLISDGAGVKQLSAAKENIVTSN